MKTNFLKKLTKKLIFSILVLATFSKGFAQLAPATPIGANYFYSWYVNPAGLWNEKTFISNADINNASATVLGSDQASNPTNIGGGYSDAKFFDYGGNHYMIIDGFTAAPVLYQIIKSGTTRTAKFIADISVSASATASGGGLDFSIVGTDLYVVYWGSGGAMWASKYNLSTLNTATPDATATAIAHWGQGCSQVGLEPTFVTAPDGVRLVCNSGTLNSVKLSDIIAGTANSNVVSTGFTGFGASNNTSATDAGRVVIYQANGNVFALVPALLGIETYKMDPTGGTWTNLGYDYVVSAGFDGTLDRRASTTQADYKVIGNKLYLFVSGNEGSLSVFTMPLNANGEPNGDISLVSSYMVPTNMSTDTNPKGTDAYDWDNINLANSHMADIVSSVNADGSITILLDYSYPALLGEFKFVPSTNTTSFVSLSGERLPNLGLTNSVGGAEAVYQKYDYLPFNNSGITSYIQGWNSSVNQLKGIAIGLDGALYLLQDNTVSVAVGSDNSPKVPIPQAVGQLDCTKSSLFPAPVFGTASSGSLVVWINVTTAGTFTPTVSGSGMSLTDPKFTITTATTGLQKFIIPVNYDGTTALGTITYSIGSGTDCTLVITTPKKGVVDMITNDNCTIKQVGPSIK